MNQRDKIVEIAKSQIGYHEGYNNDTKYGDWYGLPNQPWCAMFVSWCAYESGIPETIIPKFAGCITGFNEMTKMGITTTEHITPQKGDLIFFEWDGEPGDIDHVGIVEYVENDLVHTIEGNHSDCVDQYVYYKDSDCIVGYAKPRYEDSPEPTPDYRVSEIQRTLNERYGLSIAVDNIFGSETNWAMVFGLQTEMNIQFGTGIAVDGIFGDETYSHAIEIYPGASGNMTWIIRSWLICNGYTELPIGYNYDDDMQHSIWDFQNKNYLETDLVIGQNTQWEMFS